MTRHFLLIATLLCTACGSYKAHRPDAPTPAVPESQTHTIHYKTAKGARLIAVYINSDNPLTVELKQGNSVEKLKQIQSWAKGVEYGNTTTRWHVQENRAILTRKGKKTVYRETETD